MSNMIFLKGVDPVGTIILADNRVYRGVNREYTHLYTAIYDQCKLEGLLGTHIIHTRIAKDFTLAPFELIFEHELIDPIIYPFEWSPLMHVDAGNVFLELLVNLDKTGMGLKDGHTYNMAYHKGKFYQMDFGSIVHYQSPWCMIAEFMDWFVKPLAEQSEYASFKLEVVILAKSGEIALAAKELHKWLNRYEIMTNESRWAPYYDENKPEQELMRKIILNFIDLVRPKRVLEISQNSGGFCFTLDRMGIPVILVDSDPECINLVYKKLKVEQARFAIAVMNFLNPKKDSDQQRFRSEMVIALDLIHRVVFSQQLNFDKFVKQLRIFTTKYAVIEFIQPNDAAIKTWINSNHDWYNFANFMHAVRQEFKIINICQSGYKERLLVFCEVIATQFSHGR